MYNLNQIIMRLNELLSEAQIFHTYLEQTPLLNDLQREWALAWSRDILKTIRRLITEATFQDARQRQVSPETPDHQVDTATQKDDLHGREKAWYQAHNVSFVDFGKSAQRGLGQ